jgi:microcystin degradation protein MlrC
MKQSRKKIAAKPIPSADVEDRPRRFLIGGIWHETNTFSPIATELADFHRYQYAEGEDIRRLYAGTNTEIGGMLAAADRAGAYLFPTVFAGAVPSGTITAEAFDYLVDLFLEAAAKPSAIDCVLLALHGAMVSARDREADAYFVERIRGLLGQDIPIVATFDLHANLSRRLVDAATVLIGYDTFPHVDMAARGGEAVEVALRLCEGWRPACAFRKLPLLTVPQMQATAEPPMDEIMRMVAAAENSPEILTVSVAQGFAYADVSQLGVAVVAYGEGKAPESCADKIAAAIWKRRQAFVPKLETPEAAVRAALKVKQGPVVLAEPADNVGGGTPGDGTLVLQALIEARAPSAAVVLWDPQAVEAARRLGVGGMFAGEIGGRTLKLHGPPLSVRGKIEFLADLTYKRDGAYMTGQTVRLGWVAVLDLEGIRVMLTSERCMPFDATHLRAAGIEPAQQHILVAKSGSAWKGAFGDIVTRAIYVDTPGIAASNIARLPYRIASAKQMFPLAPDLDWKPPGKVASKPATRSK